MGEMGMLDILMHILSSVALISMIVIVLLMARDLNKRIK